MLSIRNLTKSYRTGSGRKYVFRDVSLEFPEDVNIGIIGANGVGKSTLLRILGGIDYPDSGTIECDRTMSWPLGLSGGFVGNLSGRENCRVICRIYGMSDRQIRDKLGFIKELAGIEEYFEEPIKYYSSGMRSRVGFALSIAFDFEILLIDELMSVGDRSFREVARNALDEKRGKSNIIMVSHSMGSIREFCDIGILLKDGKLTIYDDIDEGIRAYLPQDETFGKHDLSSEEIKSVGSNIFSILEDRETASLREQVVGQLMQVEQTIKNGEPTDDEGEFSYLMGLIYQQMEHFSSAVGYFRKAVKYHPDRIENYKELISVSIQQGNLDEASAVLDKAFKYWPENPWLLYQLGQIKIRNGKPKDAREAFTKAAEQVPDHSGLRNSLARAHLLEGKPKEALQQCLMGISMDAENAVIYKTLSQILVAQGRYNESIRALKEYRLKELNESQKKVSENIHLKRIRAKLEQATELIG